MPVLPPKDTSIHLCEKGKRRSICGNVEGTTRCTQKQREYTPDKLIDWLEEVLTVIRSHERKASMKKVIKLLKKAYLIAKAKVITFYNWLRIELED